MPAHLNRKQQREIKAVVERAKKDNGIPQTAQQSIPFQRMFPDGICRVTDNYYTKTIQYQDINYQLAQHTISFRRSLYAPKSDRIRPIITMMYCFVSTSLKRR